MVFFTWQTRSLIFSTAFNRCKRCIARTIRQVLGGEYASRIGTLGSARRPFNLIFIRMMGANEDRPKRQLQKQTISIFRSKTRPPEISVPKTDYWKILVSKTDQVAISSQHSSIPIYTASDRKTLGDFHEGDVQVHENMCSSTFSFSIPRFTFLYIITVCGILPSLDMQNLFFLNYSFFYFWELTTSIKKNKKKTDSLISCMTKTN